VPIPPPPAGAHTPLSAHCSPVAQSRLAEQLPPIPTVPGLMQTSAAHTRPAPQSVGGDAAEPDAAVGAGRLVVARS
jgi:hypothetical protein